MNKEDLILKILKNKDLTFKCLLEQTIFDSDELNLILEKLIKYNKIKLIDNSYSINKSYRLTKEELYDYFLENEELYEREIASHFKTKIKELDVLLNELLEDKKIGLYKPLKIYSKILTGKITVKEKGYGFVTVSGYDKDFYVDRELISNAFNNDIVNIMILGKGNSDFNTYAKVESIEERYKKQIVGRLKVRGKKYPKYYIESTDPLFNIDALVEGACDIKVGSIVVAKLIYDDYKIKACEPKLVGHPDDPGIEISEIALNYGFNLNFSDETVEELNNIPDMVLETEYEGRENFKDELIFTIDGDTSKDFDDAVSLKINDEGNFILGVYIADVSHYVKENTALNKDALSRGTSVYLADRVIPMIPHKLSNGICSLNPNVDRLVLACIMEINPKGKLINYDIKEGIINSKYRMTYNNVNKILNGDNELIEKYKEIYDTLLKMNNLAHILREIRYKRGGLEFDTAEYEFSLNPDGSPKSIDKVIRKDGEMLIEDFMLLANETVAYHMNLMNLPIIYRVHEKPDQEKLHQALNQLKSMKLKMPYNKNEISEFDLQKILLNVKDNPNSDIINDILLRSMMKAKYSDKCLGHYGLALRYYCHFTSPIRRYPDLMTHRMIKKLLLHPTDNFENDLIYYQSIMQDIASLNSDSEKKSVECEREVNDMLYAWYMEKNIGSSFKGKITSITQFGMYITLKNGVEGLLHYKNMEGYFLFDDEKNIATDGYKSYHLGDMVDVVVIDSNRKTQKIDFMLKEDYDENNLY